MIFDTFLDLFLILLKIFQQFIFLCIQKPAHMLLYAVYGIFCADHDFFARAQSSFSDVKLQFAIRQDIKPPGRMNAEHVHS